MHFDYDFWKQFQLQNSFKKKVTFEVDRLNFIYNSWVLDKKNKVNAESFKRNIQEHSHEDNNSLKEILTEIIEHICKGSHGTSWLICTREGYLQQLISSDQPFVDEIFKIGIKEGFCFDQKYSGTNAISLVRSKTHAFICKAHEHYNKTLHPYITAAMQIYNLKGEFIAICGLICKKEMGKQNLHSMLRFLSLSVDNRLRIERSTSLVKQARTRHETLFKTKHPSLLLTPNGVLKHYNQEAEQLFNIKREYNENFEKFIKFTPKLKTLSLSAIDEQGEITFIDQRKKVKLKYTKSPCYDNSDGYLGSIFSFEKVSKDIIKNKINAPKMHFEHIIGHSPAIKHAMTIAKQVSKSNISVLLLGESGTGKEVFAQSIHNDSLVKDGPFISLNCSAIPKDLAESELFGYSKGAFTGALKEGKIGKVEAAHNGTLFLDEIGDMPLDMQVKLLRVLETKTLTRVGSDKEIKVDFRLIAATHNNLEEKTEAGTFREDLYYRLAVSIIQLPPLRESKENIPVLFKTYIDLYNKRMGKNINGIDKNLLEKISHYPWKGNIRELKNAAEFAVMINKGNEPINTEHLPGKMRMYLLYNNMLPVESVDTPSNDLSNPSNTYGIEQIKACLIQYKWDINQVSKELNLSRATLYRRMKKHNLLKRDNFY